MNSIDRINVPCSVLQGLRFDKISISEDSDKVINNIATKCEHLTKHNEYDKVFNNMNIIKNMRIDKMEMSKDSVVLKANLKSFTPIKSYSNKLKIIKTYENKIKG